jgi:hypothetical protein
VDPHFQFSVGRCGVGICEGLLGGEGLSLHNLALDGEDEFGGVEGPGDDLEGGVGGFFEVEGDGGRAGLGENVFHFWEGDLIATEAEADSVHGLEDEVVSAELVLGGDARIHCEAEAEGDVVGEAEMLAQVFLSFDFSMLEFV